MIFAIIGYDGPDGRARRKLHRQAHLDRMDPLNKAGKVILAGPLTDGAGSLIVIEAGSLEEATAFAAGDPYVTQGVFARYEVHPFMQVYPTPAPAG
ncbi:MAG: YciI family protein [Nitrospirota bacterium]